MQQQELNSWELQMLKCKPMKEKLTKFKVNLETGCHEWTGAVDKDGYGRIRGTVNNVPYFIFAHRAAYLEYKGPLGVNVQVLHTCDNPPCINPEHLYPGNPKLNGADKKARGRAWCAGMPGQSNPMSATNRAKRNQM